MLMVYYLGGFLTALECKNISTIFQQITNYSESIPLYYMDFRFHMDFSHE